MAERETKHLAERSQYLVGSWGRFLDGWSAPALASSDRAAEVMKRGVALASKALKSFGGVGTASCNGRGGLSLFRGDGGGAALVDGGGPHKGAVRV